MTVMQKNLQPKGFFAPALTSVFTSSFFVAFGFAFGLVSALTENQAAFFPLIQKYSKHLLLKNATNLSSVVSLLFFLFFSPSFSFSTPAATNLMQHTKKINTCFPSNCFKDNNTVNKNMLLGGLGGGNQTFSQKFSQHLLVTLCEVHTHSFEKPLGTSFLCSCCFLFWQAWRRGRRSFP